MIIASFLLTDELFENVSTIHKTTKRVKRTINNACILCGRNADVEFEFREGVFCKDYCSSQIGTFGSLFPFK